MARLSQVFAPRDHEFFDLFEEAGQNIARAADLLDQMMSGWPERRELARDILVAPLPEDDEGRYFITRKGQRAARWTE